MTGYSTALVTRELQVGTVTSLHLLHQIEMIRSENTKSQQECGDNSQCTHINTILFPL